MGLAHQLTINAVRLAGTEARAANADAALDCNDNPFSFNAAATHLGRPQQTAFGEVIRHIGLQTPHVIVLGAPGTGKTLLTEMVARACSAMGLSVRRAESGRLIEPIIDESSDVLLVDDADCMPSTILERCLAPQAKRIARTIVFLCLPSCVTRLSFAGSNAAVVELGVLSLFDARAYLNERGMSIGQPNLFTAEAADVLIDSSRGIARVLRTMASLAYFTAASERASQIQCAHVECALRIRDEVVQAATAQNALSSTTSPAVIAVTQVAIKAPAVVIAPKPELAAAAATSAPARVVPLADKVRRSEDRPPSRFPLRARSSVALGAGLLISGIVAIGLLGAWERPRAEPYAPKVSAVPRAVSVPAQQLHTQGETDASAGEEGMLPDSAAVGGEVQQEKRRNSQPPFRTVAGLALGNAP